MCLSVVCAYLNCAHSLIYKFVCFNVIVVVSMQFYAADILLHDCNEPCDLTLGHNFLSKQSWFLLFGAGV